MDLDRWMKTLSQPWTAAMEATIFTGWSYDYLVPHAAALKVAHPLMLRAIAAKKNNDRIDASKIADCLRCDFLPACYMASTEIRERRRTLRYRNLLVRQSVQLKNKIAVLLMEAGVELQQVEAAQGGLLPGVAEDHSRHQRELAVTAATVPGNTGALAENRKCFETVARARPTPGRTGRSTDDDSRRWPNHVANLTWALEVRRRELFSSIKKAISYCGPFCAEKNSADVIKRGPLSKQRNSAC
jgi:transposase